jgi:dTMP kinase
MFITLEGIEGSGKTTQQRRLAQHLEAAGRTVVITKEPGGTPLADRIRMMLLESTSVIDPIAEVFLFAASRRQHTIDVIEPALTRGEVVLCDRYADSTLAYQGYGRLIELDRLRMVNDWATGSRKPDLTLLFDLDETTGLRRALSRNATAANDEGRFEAEDLRFHRRVREGYLALAASEPKRFAVIDANGGADDVFTRTLAALQTRAGATP